MRRHVTLITAAGALLIILPAFFARLHSDEVIYWEIAKNISTGLGPLSETAGNRAFVWHMPLPFFIVAPFLWISGHIFTARIISSLFTVSTAILVYSIAKERHGREAALVSAFLFILSFQALRFGGRYYLDQYGAFFFILTVFFMTRGRLLYAGLSAVLAVLSREHWLFVYPFFFLYLSDRKNDALFFAVPALLAAIGLSGYLYLEGGLEVLSDYALNGAALKNLKASFTNYTAYGLVSSLARAWGEFLALNILIVCGGFFILREERRFLWLVLPQLMVISMIHGFVADGGVTQYTMGLLATLSIFSGAGLKAFHQRLGVFKLGFVGLSLGILSFQYIFLNAFATLISLHGNIGVYGLGYWDDARVIEILRSGGDGKYIHGIHGAFVDGRLRWDWTDYLIQEAIDKDPDRLVTFANYVEFLPGWDSVIKVHKVGPYVMIDNPHKVPLRTAVRQKGFDRWMLNKGP